MTRLVLALLLFLGLAPPVRACQYAWTAPTTNTDGTPLTNLAMYALYSQQGTQTPVQISTITAPLTTTTTQGACTVGTYWVTAINTFGVESDPSNLVVMAKPNKPGSFNMSK